jgi:hypothetical protein
MDEQGCAELWGGLRIWLFAGASIYHEKLKKNSIPKRCAGAQCLASTVINMVGKSVRGLKSARSDYWEIRHSTYRKGLPYFKVPRLYQICG